MVRAYSQDLRERVIEAGLMGPSVRQAARQFARLRAGEITGTGDYGDRRLREITGTGYELHTFAIRSRR